MCCLVVARLANRLPWASGVGFSGQVGVVAIQIEIVPLVPVCSTAVIVVRTSTYSGTRIVLACRNPGADPRCRLVSSRRNLGRFICVAAVVADNLARSCERRLEK